MRVARHHGAVADDEIGGRGGHCGVGPHRHRPAAVDRKVDAGDLAGHVAGEKQAGIGDVGVHGHALERVIGGVTLRGLLDADIEALGHVGADFFAKARSVDHAGRDAIDVDVVLADFEREALGDAAQAPFRGGIGHASGAPAHAEGAADIDDLAVALRDHGRQHAVHDVEAAVHVERDDVVEFFRRGLDAGLADRSGAAGDVDEDIDAAAEGGLGLLRRRRRIAAATVRSQGTMMAPPPAALTDLAMGSMAALSRPTRAKCAPSAAKASVMAAPIPLAGPVIIATRPLRFKSMIGPRYERRSAGKKAAAPSPGGAAAARTIRKSGIRFSEKDHARPKKERPRTIFSAARRPAAETTA